MIVARRLLKKQAGRGRVEADLSVLIAPPLLFFVEGEGNDESQTTLAEL
jgi:hypothetical protein